MNEGADKMSDRNALFLEYGDLSTDDAKGYHRIIQQAVDVHDERERIRHGLWKKYTALDQMRQAKIKVERIFQALEYAEQESRSITALEATEQVEEGCDIINYVVFTLRILRGEISA